MRNTTVGMMLLAVLVLCVSFNSLGQDMVTFSKYKVGDTIPDIEFKNLTNYHLTTKKLSGFDEKLLIIDFWATWCAPCVAMLPKMDSLMLANKNELIFISVTKEPKAKAETFLSKFEKNLKHKLCIPVVYDDKELYKEFPHYFLPHYVWISPKTKKIVAITNQQEINNENIEHYIRSGKTNIKSLKIDSWLDYKIDQPLLPYLAKNSLAFDGKLNQYSYFSGYVDKLKPGMYTNDTSQNRRVVFKNINRLTFFTWTFGEGRRFFQDESVKLEVKDKERLTTNLSNEPFREWRKSNTFCYELSTNTKDEKVMFNIMRSDVLNYFREYEVKIEKRKQVCLVLTSTGNNDALITKNSQWSVQRSQFGYNVKNYNIPALITDWGFYHFRTNKMLIDETNIKFNIDMELEFESWNDINSINKGLAKYNLKLIEKEVLAEVLVIKDST